MVVSNIVGRSVSSSKLFYKGSTLEITRLENGPDVWNVSFNIPSSTYYPNGMGWIQRGGFKTREDALNWTRKEIDSFRT